MSEIDGNVNRLWAFSIGIMRRTRKKIGLEKLGKFRKKWKNKGKMIKIEQKIRKKIEKRGKSMFVLLARLIFTSGDENEKRLLIFTQTCEHAKQKELLRPERNSTTCSRQLR